MAVALHPFIHLEKVDGLCQFSQFTEAVVSRVEFRGLFGDITPHGAKMRPPAFIGGRLNSSSNKINQLCVSLQLERALLFHGRLGILLKP